MDSRRKEDLIVKIEGQGGRRGKVLDELNIPRSTYYQWRKSYEEEGLAGLSKVLDKVSKKISTNLAQYNEKGATANP